ncbi:AMP-binding protein, partial [Mycobacterium sp. NAZ190054]|uniref:AMP-binding protein n=1 Tax=Mycobacterium sp. NAZ190054 TaxID=1747766 RepID=UPI000B1D834C
HPGTPALTYRDETVGYAQLWDRVRGTAAGLAHLGVCREQRVAGFLIVPVPRNAVAVLASDVAVITPC